MPTTALDYSITKVAQPFYQSPFGPHLSQQDTHPYWLQPVNLDASFCRTTLTPDCQADATANEARYNDRVGYLRLVIGHV